MANLLADHAAGLASLMARGNYPSGMESLIEERQTSYMSNIIDSYIVNLEVAGFVPNANATTSKRHAFSLDSLIEKRSIPSVPLVINLLEQHGFVPVSGTNSTTSKRDVSDVESALEKRTLPDINLVISRLETYGFVPSGNSSQSSISKRDSTASELNTIISQLEAYGFNPNDYTQANTSALSFPDSSPSVLSATIGVTCPQDDGMTFSTGNDTYQIFCSADFKGFDLEHVHSDNVPECLAACPTYVPPRELPGSRTLCWRHWEGE
ncbi:MAG: hypothetical protein ALECFALPRED_005567 [Alectoria fallacina]|uniref:Uncharacterized protein n=1 Tax=Alectoria fallacina TaxID=1903189 RepID=A0A8H3IUW5_9LECA|nr:MAG: hypothetical protein ALECFALPRED_005567 [Alectoria fallacina]